MSSSPIVNISDIYYCSETYSTCVVCRWDRGRSRFYKSFKREKFCTHLNIFFNARNRALVYWFLYLPLHISKRDNVTIHPQPSLICKVREKYEETDLYIWSYNTNVKNKKWNYNLDFAGYSFYKLGENFVANTNENLFKRVRANDDI